jgi:hypothetical protein
VTFSFTRLRSPLAARTYLISGFNGLSLEGWAVVKVAMLPSTRNLEFKGLSAIVHPLKLEVKYLT